MHFGSLEFFSVNRNWIKSKIPTHSLIRTTANKLGLGSKMPYNAPTERLAKTSIKIWNIIWDNRRTVSHLCSSPSTGCWWRLISNLPLRPPVERHPATLSHSSGRSLRSGNHNPDSSGLWLHSSGLTYPPSSTWCVQEPPENLRLNTWTLQCLSTLLIVAQLSCCLCICHILAYFLLTTSSFWVTVLL